MFAFKQLVTLSFIAVASAGLTMIKRQLPIDCDRTYIVKAGDYCNKIARDQGVSTRQIFTANPGVIDSTCSNLEVDQEICLAIIGQDCQPVHIVEEGDSCESLEPLFPLDVEISDFLENNGKDENCYLFIGESVCVGAPA